MRAIIVAAGRGNRLRPLTDEKPKCLIEIAGKTILDRQLEWLNELGVDEVLVVTGHLEDQIRRAYGNQVKTISNPRFLQTNSLQSLWCAKDEFGNDFIYLHSDIIFDPDILKSQLRADYDRSLVIDAKTCDIEDMKVIISDGRLTSINKSIIPDQATGEFIGIARFRGAGVEELISAMNWCVRFAPADAYFELALERMIKEDMIINPVYTEGKPWIEIDFVEDLEKARQMYVGADA